MADETLDITAETAAALGTQLARAFDARTAEPGLPARREPDETWELSGGTAWVFRVPDNQSLTKPVIVADGFGAGASTLDEWAGLWGLGSGGGHAWGTQLHERRRDVIVLGYKSRNAPIRDNAAVAKECIFRTIAERQGDAPLVVGGLSMGGLVTRYALAQLERQRMDHQTATYFSYDSPHRGAWIPISLQVFAHFLKGLADQLGSLMPEEDKEKLRGMSRLINSDAACELLWKHTATHIGVGPMFEADQKRTDFLAALAAAGNWPQRPHKIAVANGRGDGKGLDGVTPGEPNLVWPAALLKPSATLYSQPAEDNELVAALKPIVGAMIEVSTAEIPALDGAPGGTLDSFGIAAHALEEAGFAATAAFPDVCFVPVASAVDLADPSKPFEPVNDMNRERSGLDDFKVASQNEGHTLLTAELCDWLTEQFGGS